MKKSKLRPCSVIISAVLALTVLGGCTAATEEEGDVSVSETTAAVTPVTEISAKDDFYGYVNLEKLDSMEIGFGSVSAGSFDEAQEIIDERIEEMLREIGESDEAFPKGSSEQLIHDILVKYEEFDSTCESSEDTFSDVFAKIDGAQNVSGFMTVCGEIFRDYGVNVMLDIYADMNLLDAKNYGVYISGGNAAYGMYAYEDLIGNTSSALALKSYNESMLKAFGVDSDSVDERAEDMVNIVMDVALASDEEVLKDPMPIKYITSVTAEEISGIFTGFDFCEYMKAIGADKLPDVYYTMDKGQLEAINSVLTDENLTALKDHAKASFVSAYGYFLPDSMKHLRDKYFSMPKGKREKIVFDDINGRFPMLIGEAYAKRYADEEVLTAAEEMCEKLRESYYGLIGNAEWLSEGTRTLLQKKLSNLKFVIGSSAYDEDNEYRAKLIGSDLLQTIININSEEIRENLSHIGEGYSPDLMGMPPHIVNACYNTNNTITIPMGITVSPFFDIERSDAQNLGALGSIIAHEMSHAFDSDCIAFDADGNYDPDWLPEADRLAFEEKMRLTEEYYSKFTIMDVYHVDGENTLGENFADLGGVECVLSAVSSDSEKKELLESYASIWCSLEKDIYAIEALRFDVHSPATVRVNAVISSCDDYYRLYDVNEGDGMYIPPEDRVSRW